MNGKQPVALLRKAKEYIRSKVLVKSIERIWILAYKPPPLPLFNKHNHYALINLTAISLYIYIAFHVDR